MIILSEVKRMPTETFFNLPKEKQERIINAARQEFSRVSLNEASIANIIKAAGIPRGSFYQYFEDKEDIYFYCFHLMHQTGFEHLAKALQRANGNLFQGFREFFTVALPMIFSSEHAQFFRNSIMHMDYRASREMTKKFMKKHPHLEQQPFEKMHQHHPPHAKALLELIDQSSLEVANDEELQMLVQMVMNAVFSTIIEGFRMQKENQDLDVNQLLQHLYRKLAWLESGASRKEKIHG